MTNAMPTPAQVRAAIEAVKPAAARSGRIDHEAEHSRKIDAAIASMRARDVAERADVDRVVALLAPLYGRTDLPLSARQQVRELLHDLAVMFGPMVAGLERRPARTKSS